MLSTNAYGMWSPRPTQQQYRARGQVNKLLRYFDFPCCFAMDYRWLLRNLWRREYNRKHRLYRPVMRLLCMT